MIGKGGSKLKELGSMAREKLEKVGRLSQSYVRIINLLFVGDVFEYVRSV